jgi:hypothetical protein
MTLLTQELVNFVISSTVPDCCIAISCNVTLCAIEHKMLRIRHNLVYVKMYIAQLL